MVVPPGSHFPNRIFNVNSTDDGLAKAKSRLNAGNRIVAKSCPAFSKGKPSAPRSQFSLETKTRVRKHTKQCAKLFVLRTRISLTRRSTEFATGRVAAALARAKPSVASPLPLLLAKS